MQRIIDANLNRLAEGLRVLEDVARFALNHELLDRELRALRHQLREGLKPMETGLISSRDAGADIGAEAEGPARTGREDLAGLAAANARRAQEALRVLEETARLPEMAAAMNGDIYARARFALYDIEKRILALLWRRDKRQAIRGLYVIIDTDALRGRKAADVAGQAIQGGARVIQLRDKATPKGALEETALALKVLCKQHGVPFMVNDYLDIALASGADGLHLGQKDMAVATARRLLPVDTIIGCSTKTVDQALKAQAEGADYVAVGAIYPTSTKVETVLVGVERLREIKSRTSLPVVAIGGINRGNTAEVVEAGADAVAVITAVLSADDVAQAASQMASAIERAQRGRSQ